MIPRLPFIKNTQTSKPTAHSACQQKIMELEKKLGILRGIIAVIQVERQRKVVETMKKGRMKMVMMSLTYILLTMTMRITGGT